MLQKEDIAVTNRLLRYFFIHEPLYGIPDRYGAIKYLHHLIAITNYICEDNGTRCMQRLLIQ